MLFFFLFFKLRWWCRLWGTFLEVEANQENTRKNKKATAYIGSEDGGETSHEQTSDKLDGSMEMWDVAKDHVKDTTRNDFQTFMPPMMDTLLNSESQVGNNISFSQVGLHISQYWFSDVEWYLSSYQSLMDSYLLQTHFLPTPLNFPDICHLPSDVGYYLSGRRHAFESR